MTTVTLNSNEYSADGTGDRDMLNGGHRTWFIPCLSDTLVEVADAATSATASATSAAEAAVYAAALSGTSATSTTVGTGSKSFTASTGKQWQVGQYVYVARTSAPTTYMAGQVTAYTSGTGALTVDVQSTNGSGTYSDWTITIGGAKGATGSINTKATSDKSGTYTLVSGDLGTMIRCTGTWTLSVTAAATLTAGWWCYVVNEGTGEITIDPDGAETIRGASTLVLYPGEGILLTCKSTSSDHFEALFVSNGGTARLAVISSAASAMTAFDRPCLFEQETTAGPGTASATPGSFYAGSLYLMVQAGQTTLWTSGDGATWTGRTAAAAAAGTAFSHAYGASAHVILHNGSVNTCSSSPDGVTWTSRTLPATTTWVGVAFRGTTFCAVASAATNAATSTDGSTWTTRTKNLSATCNGFLANSSVFLATYASGTSYETSADGVTWTSRTVPGSASSMQVVAVANDLFFALAGANGALLFYSSSDGITWTQRKVPAALTSIARVYYANGVYLVLGIRASVYEWYVTTDFDTYHYLESAASTASTLSPTAFDGSSLRYSSDSSFRATYKSKSAADWKGWFSR